jgi:hypothetical protein
MSVDGFVCMIMFIDVSTTFYIKKACYYYECRSVIRPSQLRTCWWQLLFSLLNHWSRSNTQKFHQGYICLSEASRHVSINTLDRVQYALLRYQTLQFMYFCFEITWPTEEQRDTVVDFTYQHDGFSCWKMTEYHVQLRGMYTHQDRT